MSSTPDIRRAVVIEDDPDIRGLLVRVLVKQGFEVTEAERACRAWKTSAAPSRTWSPWT